MVPGLDVFTGEIWVRRIFGPGRFSEGMERNGRCVFFGGIDCMFDLGRFAGKYVGNRPVKLKKADNTAIRPVEIGHRKAKQLEQELKKNRRKPY